MHLPLRPIFRQSHPNFISVRTAYDSKIWAQLTKNLLAKSSTKRFREYIKKKEGIFMIANVIILLLIFGYCGLVIYWKRTGALKDSCSSCGSGKSGCGCGCGCGCGGCSGHCSSCGSVHAHHEDVHKTMKKH